MFRPRKRIKTEENIINPLKDVWKYIIFKKLSIQDKLSLRLVNKEFSEMIERPKTFYERVTKRKKAPVGKRACNLRNEIIQRLERCVKDGWDFTVFSFENIILSLDEVLTLRNMGFKVDSDVMLYTVYW